MNNVCILGKPFTLSISAPSVGDSAEVHILAHTGQLVTQLEATRDPGSNRVYTVTFTLPTSVPVPRDSINELYEAELYNSNGEVASVKTFSVLAEAEPIAHDSDVLVFEGSPILDQLILPYPLEETDTVNISILNGDMTVFTKEFTGLESKQFGKYYSVYIEIPQKSTDFVTGYEDHLHMGEYLLRWDVTGLTVSGMPYNKTTEFHNLCSVDGSGVYIINAIRRDIDKSRYLDLDETLTFTDVELAHFIFMAVRRFNMLGSRITQFTIANIDQQFFWCIEKLAVIEALEAWALDEGLKDFDFTGASLNLRLNRAAAIKDAIGRLNSSVLPKIEKAKETLVQMTVGALAVGQISTVTNRLRGVPIAYPNNLNYRNGGEGFSY